MVIKLGTAVLTDDKGGIVQATVKKVAAGIAGLSADYHVILVSSGAVGSGRAYFSGYKGTLAEKGRLLRPSGNPILIRHYQRHFSAYGIPVAQALATAAFLQPQPISPAQGDF